MTETLKITGKTKISEIIEKCPDSVFVLMEYGLMCARCQFASEHTLNSTKNIYGFNNEEIKEMLKRINELMKKNEAKK